MARIHAGTPVEKLAAGQPRVWTVLERFGIDYGSSGALSLAACCDRMGLSAEAVLEDVARARQLDACPDLEAFSLSELVAYVRSVHHGYLKSELPALAARLARVARTESGPRSELEELTRLFANFQLEMETHMMKEEHVLFPAILEMESGRRPMRLDRPILVMEQEHEASIRDLEAMRQVTRGFEPPTGASNTMRALLYGLAELQRDTRRHIDIENQLLFPRALGRQAQDL